MRWGAHVRLKAGGPVGLVFALWVYRGELFVEVVWSSGLELALPAGCFELADP